MENSDTSIIVFTATCFQCALLRQMLAELDISAVALHSQMKQHEYERCFIGSITVVLVTILCYIVVSIILIALLSLLL